MRVKVYIDGEVLGPERATISVFDRGFLYGDSVYEVMRTSGGRPVDRDRHLERLGRSAAHLALTVPEHEVLVRAIDETLAAAANEESYIRVIVTRGSGEIGLDVALADDPKLIVIVKPLVLLPDEAYAHGVVLRIVEVRRVSKFAVDPTVKSGNYLNNIMALREARMRGAYEALMCDDHGRIAEGSSSNLFIVHQDRLITPAHEVGLLRGITRDRVMELASAHGIEVREETVVPDDVRGADEAFITSSIRGVVPVCCVDETEYAPVPGRLTRQIMSWYAAYLANMARPA